MVVPSHPQKPAIPRVHVFFDGQNLYHAAKECFSYPFPNYDPIKLAEAVVAVVPGRRLEKIHFYTGIHDIRQDPFWHSFWSNKLALLPTKGVNVVTRKLKYSDVPVLLPGGGTKVIKVGREKGVDLRLGLDLVRLARRGEYDVAVIFSQDTDLEEAIDEVYDIRQEFKRWIWLECAFPISSTAKNPRGISRTQWRTIDKALYDRCKENVSRSPISEEIAFICSIWARRVLKPVGPSTPVLTVFKHPVPLVWHGRTTTSRGNQRIEPKSVN